LFCSQCGEKIKDGAKFCHACGTQVAGEKAPVNAQTNSKSKKVSTQSWLNSFGAFLFIPIFALIIVLLFWANRDPEPINGGGQQQQMAQGQGNGTPDMAAMEQVHNTLENLKARVEENPNDLVALDSLAMMYSIAGSFGKAKEYYERYLAIQPDNKDVKVSLALAHYQLQEQDKAIEIIEGILDEEPTYALGLHYLAEIYASMHEHDKAIEKWNTIIAHYPNTEFSKVAEKRIKEQQSHSDE